jgi:hypothetical protein
VLGVHVVIAWGVGVLGRGCGADLCPLGGGERGYIGAAVGIGGTETFAEGDAVRGAAETFAGSIASALALGRADNRTAASAAVDDREAANAAGARGRARGWGDG